MPPRRWRARGGRRKSAGGSACPCARGVVGSADLDAAEIGAFLCRVIAVRSARNRLLHGLEEIFEQRRRAVEERQRDRARPRLCGEANLPVGVESAAIASGSVAPSFDRSIRLQLEDVHRHAVDAELEPLRLVEYRNLVEARADVPRQLHAHAVLAVAREGVAQRRAAASAERQAFESIVLTKLGRHEKRVGRRGARRRADRNPADLLRRRRGTAPSTSATSAARPRYCRTHSSHRLPAASR